MDKHLERLCFICEIPLTSARSQKYKETMTCSTDCGVILRDININDKVFVCEIQSFLDWSDYKTDIQCFINWSVGLKTDVKVVNCWQCYQIIGLKPKTSTQRFCTRCAKHRNKFNSDKYHKDQMELSTSYRRKQTALAARNRHKRRTLEANGDLIDLYELAERDQWQCKLCSMPIDKNNKHSKGSLHLMGPSLDHIVPVSKGGSHRWSNVQLAHFMCNSLRGNKDLVR